jgi:YodL-like
MIVKIFHNDTRNGQGAFRPEDDLRCVWGGDLPGADDAEVLEGARARFGTAQPDDFRDRPLSVGDVIVLMPGGTPGFQGYAVGEAGFAPVEITPLLAAAKPGTIEVDAFWGADETPDYPALEG